MTDGWMSRWLDAWMPGWLDAWMAGWLAGWEDGMLAGWLKDANERWGHRSNTLDAWRGRRIFGFEQDSMCFKELYNMFNMCQEIKISKR